MEKKMLEDIKKLKNNKNVRFSELVNICERYFGEKRIRGSHHVFRTPWKGDPRINLQDESGKAKGYQIKQVVRALEKLLEMENDRNK